MFHLFRARKGACGKAASERRFLYVHQEHERSGAQSLGSFEHMAYLFDVGKQGFALPGSDGSGPESGLWHIDSNQAARLRTLLHYRIFLAAGTDGQVIYALTGSGKLLVIDPNHEGGK